MAERQATGKCKRAASGSAHASSRALGSQSPSHARGSSHIDEATPAACSQTHAATPAACSHCRWRSSSMRFCHVSRGELRRAQASSREIDRDWGRSGEIAPATSRGARARQMPARRRRRAASRRAAGGGGVARGRAGRRAGAARAMSSCGRPRRRRPTYGHAGALGTAGGMRFGRRWKAVDGCGRPWAAVEGRGRLWKVGARRWKAAEGCGRSVDGRGRPWAAVEGRRRLRKATTHQKR